MFYLQSASRNERWLPTPAPRLRLPEFNAFAPSDASRHRPPPHRNGGVRNSAPKCRSRRI